MRFLSLILLSGCALVDAAGEADPVSRLELTPSTVGGFSVPPKQAHVANLDGSFGPDIVVLAGDGEMLQGIHDGGSYTISVLTDMPALLGPYTAIAVGNVDGASPDDMLGAGVDRLNVFGTGAKSLGSHTVTGATPKTMTTGVFPSIGGAGRGIVISYVESTSVQFVVNPFANAPDILDRVITATSPPVAVVVAELLENGVGQDEVLIVERSSVIEARADSGNFTTVGRGFGGVDITHVALGDFGSAFSVDLAYAYEGGISIANGSPSGLTEGVTPPRIALDYQVQEMRSGNFDRDGRPDLAVLSAGDPRELHLYLRGTGETFRETVIPIEGLPETFTVGDLDDDGADDFLLTPGKEGGIDLLLSR